MIARTRRSGNTAVGVLFSILTVVCVLAVVALCAWNFFRARAESLARMAPPAPTPRAVVELPPNTSMNDLIELASAGLEEAVEWSDEQYVEALDAYLYTPQPGPNIDRFLYDQLMLDALDAEINPHLLAVLRDWGIRDKLAQSLPVTELGVTLHRTPLDRAVYLFDKPVPRDAVPALAPMLENEDPAIRAAGARALARLETPQAIPAIRKALGDDAIEVRHAALEGLSWTGSLDHISGPGSSELYRTLAEMPETGEFAHVVPQLMVGIDPEAATAHFLGTDLVAMVEQERLTHILAGFAAWNQPLPRERLLPVVSALRASPPEKPMCESLGHAVVILALEHNKRDESMLRVLASSNHNCHEGSAAQALLTLNGFGNLDSHFFTRSMEVGHGGLTTPERHVSVAMDLFVCGREGSLLDTFELVVQEDWREGLEGLRAMGAVPHSQIYEAAIAKFAPDGPSIDQAVRTRQVADLRAAHAFDKLDAAWDALETPVMPYVVDYVLAHPDDFVGLREVVEEPQ